MEDRVALNGFRLAGSHGVTAEERSKRQEFAIDIECGVDVARAAAVDELAATLDYRILRDIAAEVVGGPPRQLLETLAEDIAGRVLARTDVASVRVALTKLRPAGLDAPATVKIVRRRITPTGGAWPMVELHVPDFAPVRAFYGRLGFVVEREEAGADGYLVMRRSSTALAFWPGSPAVFGHPFFGRYAPDAPRGNGVEIIVEVEDLDALYAEARAFAEIVAPLQDRPWGARDFRVADPFGYYLRITEAPRLALIRGPADRR